MSRFSDALSCLGCLLLFHVGSFIICFLVWLLRVYGPFLLAVGIIIFAPYAIIKCMMDEDD